jgi:exonuclease VII small subunit
MDEHMTSPKKDPDPRTSASRSLRIAAVVAAAVVVLSIIGYAGHRSRSLGDAEERASTADPPAPSASRLAESDASSRSPASGSSAEVDPSPPLPEDDIAALEQAFERARDEHDAAIADVMQARAALDDSERAVEDLEQFIQDLKDRGEDPADHAEEGMAKFRPAFDAYEKAMKELERAEAREALALEERRSAEQRWFAARRSGPSPDPNRD